jgi:hypothetical protein
MDPQFDEAPRRAGRYWYEDGLVEIGTGLLFLLLAGLFAVEALAPAGALPPWFSAAGIPLIILGGIVLLGLGLGALKRRLTYPRTGYVAYPPTRPIRKALAAIIGGTVGLLLVLLLLAHPEWLKALPAVQGAAVAAVWLLLSLRMGVPRMAMQGLLALAAGVAASLAGLQTSLATASVFGAAGVGSFTSGVFVLVRYLQTTAPPAKAAG